MNMNVKRITPVLFVTEIEPVLPFWVEKLGFTKTIEVPHGNKIGFVVLQKGNTEVMYQSYASVEEDMPLITVFDGANAICGSSRKDRPV